MDQHAAIVHLYTSAPRAVGEDICDFLICKVVQMLVTFSEMAPKSSSLKCGCFIQMLPAVYDRQTITVQTTPLLMMLLDPSPNMNPLAPRPKPLLQALDAVCLQPIFGGTGRLLHAAQ